ncbi:MAG: hypothetical protein AAF465_13370 [Pseudomonadota bacterium]
MSRPLEEADTPIDQLFEQSVVNGSAKFWAAHFSAARFRPGVKAALCFAHAMDLLTTVGAEVIAEKSVWWHEELNGTLPARHPITKALMGSVSATATPDCGQAIAQTMHEHLHGALMTQQRTAMSSTEIWHQYAELRFGTFHALLSLVSGASVSEANQVADWTALFYALLVSNHPQFFDDSRVLTPSNALARTNDSNHALKQCLSAMPPMPAANRILIEHDRRWWQTGLTEAPPSHSGAPLGLRSMLASWRFARQASRSV